MGSCCGSKPQSKKQPRYNDESHSNDTFNKQQKEQNENGEAKPQKIDSKKIMKKKENGITIGGADAQPMNEDERRRKAAEAAEQRQQANKNRGLSHQGIVEMQFKEKNKLEAEQYEKKNENYVLQVNLKLATQQIALLYQFIFFKIVEMRGQHEVPRLNNLRKVLTIIASYISKFTDIQVKRIQKRSSNSKFQNKNTRKREI